MTREEMNQLKKDRGYSFQKLSDLSGVSVSTLKKIFSGETSHPRKSTIEAIEQILLEKETHTPENTWPDTRHTGEWPNCIHEAAVVYSDLPDDKTDRELPSFRGKKQGEYTIDDYHALPDDMRYELIDLAPIAESIEELGNLEE